MDAISTRPYLILDTHDWDTCATDVARAAHTNDVICIDLRAAPSRTLKTVLDSLRDHGEARRPIVLIVGSKLLSEVRAWLDVPRKSKRDHGGQQAPLWKGFGRQAAYANIAVVALNKCEYPAEEDYTHDRGWLRSRADRLASLRFRTGQGGEDFEVEVEDLLRIEEANLPRILDRYLHSLGCVLEHPEYHVATSGAHAEKLYRILPLLQDQSLAELLAFHLSRLVSLWNPEAIVTWAKTGVVLANTVSAFLPSKPPVLKVRHDLLGSPISFDVGVAPGVEGKRVLLLQDVVGTGNHTLSLAEIVRVAGGQLIGVASLLAFAQGYEWRGHKWRSKLDETWQRTIPFAALKEVDDDLFLPEPMECKPCQEDRPAVSSAHFVEIAMPKARRRTFDYSPSQVRFFNLMAGIQRNGALGDPPGATNLHHHGGFVLTDKLAGDEGCITEMIDCITEVIRGERIEFEYIVSAPNPLSEKITSALGAIFKENCRAMLTAQWSESTDTYEVRGHSVMPKAARSAKVLIIDAGATSGTGLVNLLNLVNQATSVIAFVPFNRMKEGGMERVGHWLTGGSKSLISMCPLYSEWHDPRNCYQEQYLVRLGYLLGEAQEFSPVLRGALEKTKVDQTYPAQLFPPRMDRFAPHLAAQSVAGIKPQQYLEFYEAAEKTKAAVDENFWLPFYRVVCGDAAAKVGLELIPMLARNPKQVPRRLATGVLRSLSIEQIRSLREHLALICGSADADVDVAVEALLALVCFSLTNVTAQILQSVAGKIHGVRETMERQRLYARLIFGMYETFREPQLLTPLVAAAKTIPSSNTISSDLLHDLTALQRIVKGPKLLKTHREYAYDWESCQWRPQPVLTGRMASAGEEVLSAGGMVFDLIAGQVRVPGLLISGKAELAITQAFLEDFPQGGQLPPAISVGYLQERVKDRPVNVRNNFRNFF